LDLVAGARREEKLEGQLPGAAGRLGRRPGPAAPLGPDQGGTRGQERGAKLAPPPGFDVPELGGPGDGFQAEPRPERRFQTTYYDTPDLRLARWGASLRSRPGEGG